MMVCECCAIGKAKQKRVKIEKPKEKMKKLMEEFTWTCLAS